LSLVLPWKRQRGKLESLAALRSAGKPATWPRYSLPAAKMLDGLLTKVRAALPVALERLESIAKHSEDEGVAVRASLGLWDIFGRVSDRMELEERIAALESSATKQSNGGLQ
jgi:hypothetical protein